MANSRGFLSAFASLALAASIVVACSSSNSSPEAAEQTQAQGSAAGEPSGDASQSAQGGAAGTPSDGPAMEEPSGAAMAGAPPSSGGAPPSETPQASGGAPGSSGGDAGAAATPEPEEPTEGFLRGQAYVKKNECITCHQADFSGFTVFPNITPDEETGIGSWSDEEIVAAFRNGIGKDGKKLCITMQKYPASDEEAADVVEFLRGIPAVKHKITSVCPGHGG